MEKITYQMFTYYVGKTLEHCQTVEHDVKWLYALMQKGNPMEKYEEIKQYSLGQTIFEIENFEAINKSKILGKNEYQLLKQITSERNYICHQIFRDFLYEENFIQSNAYEKACLRLMSFYNKIEKLQIQIEKFRIKFAKENT